MLVKAIININYINMNKFQKLERDYSKEPLNIDSGSNESAHITKDDFDAFKDEYTYHESHMENIEISKYNQDN